MHLSTLCFYSLNRAALLPARSRDAGALAWFSAASDQGRSISCWSLSPPTVPPAAFLRVDVEDRWQAARGKLDFSVGQVPGPSRPMSASANALGSPLPSPHGGCSRPLCRHSPTCITNSPGPRARCPALHAVQLGRVPDKWGSSAPHHRKQEDTFVSQSPGRVKRKPSGSFSLEG